MKSPIEFQATFSKFYMGLACVDVQVPAQYICTSFLAILITCTACSPNHKCASVKKSFLLASDLKIQGQTESHKKMN